MKDSDISKPQDLDAALAGNAMHKRERLWRAAEGRPLGWAHVFGVVLGALLIFRGAYEGFFDQMNAMGSIVLGLCLLIGATNWRLQSQIAALRELLKLESSGNR